MSIKIIKKNQQAVGSFDNGAIIENKPIGFPHENSTQKPYSNLFYWANAWSKDGGLIDEHPHNLFEIMSFVIEGEIEHYDNKFKKWLKLKAGDVQIIRAGNGITHAERILGGGRMFQIWFDPNVLNTMKQEASYDDYRSVDMKYLEQDGIKIKNYVGNGGPVKMESEGVIINELDVAKENRLLKLDKTKIHAFYILKGNLEIENENLEENDFVVIEDEEIVELKNKDKITLFEVAVPKILSHKTYEQLL